MDIAKPYGNSVVIIGAGTQGRRLAYMWSSRGGNVFLVDINEQQLQDGLRYVQELRDRTTSHVGAWGVIRVSPPDALETLLKSAWLVIECVPENLVLKQRVILQLELLAPDHTIIASNSSSYGIAEIMQDMKFRNTKRLLSAHCYWPPETSAIEIMGHTDTDPALINLLLQQCREHGFSPYRVRQSSIGVWAAIKRETLLALAEGICGPQEIDAIFKDVLKTPKGPCEQMDVVGLDVVLDIENHYAESRTGIPTEPREYLERMIQNGRLGRKSGQGFYNYSDSREDKI